MSTTSAIESGRGLGLQSSDRQRAYRRAMRHSRWVRVLRTTIPIVVALMLAVVVLVRVVDPMQVLARLPGSIQGVVISGTKITMQGPKLSGFTKDSRRYEISAVTASQDVTKPTLIELSTIDASVEAGENTTVKIVAGDGLFDRSSGMLTLNRNVMLKATNGFEMYFDTAVINTNTSEVVSEKPVRVVNDRTTLRSDRFELTDGGEVAIFSGGVVMNLPGSELQPSPPPPVPPPQLKR